MKVKIKNEEQMMKMLMGKGRDLSPIELERLLRSKNNLSNIRAYNEYLAPMMRGNGKPSKKVLNF